MSPGKFVEIKVTLGDKGRAHCNYSFLEGSFQNHSVIFIVEGLGEARPHDLPFTEQVPLLSPCYAGPDHRICSETRGSSKLSGANTHKSIENHTFCHL